jgi:hypothetical protein
MNEININHDIEILLNKVIYYIKEYKDIILNEANTRSCLIEPILLLTGWDVLNPAEVTREHNVSNGGYVDYKLKNKDLTLYIEAKSLNTKFIEKDIDQIRTYAYNDGIDYCILTNGDVYQLYKINTFDKLPLINFCLSDISKSIMEKFKILYLILRNIDLIKNNERIFFPKNIYEKKFIHLADNNKIYKPIKQLFYNFCENIKLEKNQAGFYIFTNINKHDFEIFINKKISMTKLCKILDEDKFSVQCSSHSLNGKTIRGIKFDQEFFKK